MNHTLHALACANGAAMRSLSAHQLHGLNEDQMASVILQAMPGAPLASSQQLESWAYGVLNDAGLGGLDDLGRLKKLKKKLRGAVKKVAKAHVKFVSKQAQYARKNPMAVLSIAAGAATGNPALIKAGIRKAAQDKVKRTVQAKLAKAQAKIQTVADDIAPFVEQANQVVQQGGDLVDQLMPLYDRFGNPLYRANGEPALGEVTRLPMADDQPRIVGLSLDGIVDTIKANPVPWLIAGGVGVWIWGNRHAN